MGAHATSDNAVAENKGASAESTCAAAKGGGGKKHPPLPGRAPKAQRDAHAAAQAAALQKAAELEHQAGQQKAAATAALKQRLEQEEKEAAATARAANAVMVAARKARDAADAAAEKKRLSRVSGFGCTFAGACGGQCTYCLHVNPNMADRYAGGADDETYRGMYGNSTPDGIKRAYARAGGGWKGEQAVLKLLNKAFR
jgi:hypothetical protein